ncbi:1,2-phenylacetyl-CoA epoxidase subunit PaaC [Acuticoccus mangrovi]|uniref:Phenylacetate-CoA oxygenase subunit PaaC n=1 Tax=Acuticoccus mangrovi TaxID=2796142 RepID=A0A934MHL2_9HYPH|nr:1,2-phenylacetyl-CoA epoxidase subunit PaaC [Acuticoccus mangrovi]MBJ3776201.1 phenylacetate-CoA oxygenase subunit PaaC [Acuticoccus mangrovi]
MTTLTLTAPSPHLAFLLRLADDNLILGHRLSEWTGHAPMLEEDIALANIALDHIGAARSLYDRAAELHGEGLTEDDYAYRRDARGYLNCLLVERPNGDFAHTIVRQLLYSAFALPYWAVLTASTDATIAAIAAKSEKEARYHVRHSGDWFLRLGDGTDESRTRTEAALAALWPYTGELFEVDATLEPLIAEGVAADPRSVHAVWQQTIDQALAATGLTVPEVPFMQTGGRTGYHTEHLGFILADLQFMQRAYPGATW